MSKLKEKGITLVALVVTIIILLILAGVTIAQIGGNNGLFSKVRQAVGKYKNASLDEELAIGEIERYFEGFNITEKEEGVQIEIKPKLTVSLKTIKVDVEVTGGEVSKVEYKLNTRNEWEQNKEDEKSLTYTFENLSIGTYYVKVRAYDKNGKYVEAESEIITIGETTTAQEEDVLAEKTFLTGEGEIKTGKMTDQGDLNKTVKVGENLKLGAGYYSGGTITVDNLQNEFTITDLKDKVTPTPSIIGKKVTGLTVGSYEWQIFYVDDSNIYLISTDYIKITDCPKKENVSISQGSTEYKGHWSTELLNKYTGSEDIKENKIKNLNKDFFITNKYKSTDNNMKAVAYMLDTEIWTNQIVGNNDKVDYVIGGPTIELLFNAYNAKYGTNYGSKVFVQNSTTAYAANVDNGNWQDELTLKNEYNINDSTFTIKDTSKATAPWIASPSARSNVDVYRLSSSSLRRTWLL